MSNVLSSIQVGYREKVEVGVEELLDKSRWTDDEFKLLTSYLTYNEDDRQQALGAVPIENLLGSLGINFPTGKHTPQVCCFLPGHADNTASMTLYRRTNSCYCFGCRRRLNTIDLLVQLYGKSYNEAMDYLLGDCLQLPAQLLRRHIKARFAKLGHKREQPQRRPNLQLIKPSSLEDGESKPPILAPVAGFAHQESRRLQDDLAVEIAGRQVEIEQILAAAANFYHFQLENCPKAYQYLMGRGLTEATIKGHKLGYASGVGLSGWLKSHHLDHDLAAKMGLLGMGGAERLVGRIILPIFGHEGKVAGLTGRYLCSQLESYRWLETDTPEDSETSGVVENESDKTPPKYLHLRLPKPHLRLFLPSTPVEPSDYLLLVEGPFDYLVASQCGYQVACSFGTNLGSENVQFLKKLLATERLGQLLICFDNDPNRLLPDGTLAPGAGPKAAAELLAALDNPRVKVLKLPQDVKDIANLGELPEGETLLAQAIKQVYSSTTPA